MVDAKETNRKALPHLPALEFPSQSIIVYVTQVVARRRPILARREAVEVLVDAWRRADHWMVGHYVVMPDHVHLFCAPVLVPRKPLAHWMAFWKADVSRRWPWPEEKPVWQKDFFDRQLRSGESYSRKWSYVRENPERAGLVDAATWPWQGELNPLTWHDAG